jgi:hypothetical protein
VLGAYGSRPAAVGLYAVTAALLSTAGGLMARHAHDAGLLWPDVYDTMSSGRRWWLAPAILLLAIPFSVLVGAWALLLWLLLAVVRRTGAATLAS